MKRLLLILALLPMTTAILAADAPAKTPAATAAAPAKAPATDNPAATKAPATDSKATAAKNDDKKADTEPFIPTVKISEDLSVSFPSDI